VAGFYFSWVYYYRFFGSTYFIHLVLFRGSIKRTLLLSTQMRNVLTSLTQPGCQATSPLVSIFWTMSKMSLNEHLHLWLKILW
jgi:hypothetical protein